MVDPPTLRAAIPVVAVTATFPPNDSTMSPIKVDFPEPAGPNTAQFFPLFKSATIESLIDADLRLLKSRRLGCSVSIIMSHRFLVDGFTVRFDIVEDRQGDAVADHPSHYVVVGGELCRRNVPRRV